MNVCEGTLGLMGCVCVCEGAGGGLLDNMTSLTSGSGPTTLSWCFSFPRVLHFSATEQYSQLSAGSTIPRAPQELKPSKHNCSSWLCACKMVLLGHFACQLAKAFMFGNSCFRQQMDLLQTLICVHVWHQGCKHGSKHDKQPSWLSVMFKCVSKHA